MIIFISGSINSGKSTVAKGLAKRFDKMAVVEVDCLREFVDFLPLKEAIPINLKNTVSVVKNLYEEGIGAIVPYPLSQENYKFISEQLAEYRDELQFFTLAPDLAVAANHRGKRRLTAAEIERVKYHYEIGINKPSFGIVVDNTNQTPQQTVEEIYKKI